MEETLGAEGDNWAWRRHAEGRLCWAMYVFFHPRVGLAKDIVSVHTNMIFLSFVLGGCVHVPMFAKMKGSKEGQPDLAGRYLMISITMEGVCWTNLCQMMSEVLVSPYTPRVPLHPSLDSAQADAATAAVSASFTSSTTHPDTYRRSRPTVCPILTHSDPQAKDEFIKELLGCIPRVGTPPPSAVSSILEGRLGENSRRPREGAVSPIV
jgi:hypothetical protein